MPVGEKVLYPGTCERWKAESVQFGDENVRNDCVEGGAVVHKEQSDVALLLLQVGQHRVEGYGDGVLCGSVCRICKLVWVEVWRKIVLDVLEDQPLKALHDYQSEGHRAIII